MEKAKVSDKKEKREPAEKFQASYYVIMLNPCCIMPHLIPCCIFENFLVGGGEAKSAKA